MPALLAPSRLTVSMIRAGAASIARRLDEWTLHALNVGVPPRTTDV